MIVNEYKTRRLILRVFPAEDAIRRYSEANNWPETGSTEEDLNAGTVYEVMWMVTPHLIFHYAEDRATRTAYIMASSWSADLAEDLSAQLERDLNVIPFAELLDRVDGATDGPGLSLAINRLTLGAPRQYDNEVFERVRKGLEDNRENVRLASIWAISFAPWPEYRKHLQEMAKAEPDQQVREAASDMLMAYQLGGGSL